MIKPILISIAIVLAIVAGNYVRHYQRKNHHDKMMVMAENGFSTGCYAFSQHHCAPLEEDKRYACYEDALAFCPVQALSFKDWIDKGK